jgi:hypothetical protein
VRQATVLRFVRNKYLREAALVLRWVKALSRKCHKTLQIPRVLAGSAANARVSRGIQRSVRRPAELWQRTYVSTGNRMNLFRACGDKGLRTLEDAMNWSMYTADRTTHLKIVVVGLTAALLISVIGISAREFNLGTDIMTAQAPTVLKASKTTEFTLRDGATIR